MIVKFYAGIVTFLILQAISGMAYAETVMTLDRTQLAADIGDRHVSFVAYDLETDTRYELEGSELGVRHTPWSTFKIPNLLMALEQGVVTDVDVVSPWDQQRRPPLGYWPDSWRQEQSLRTAFQRSAVWYFRDLAEQIDVASYRTTLSNWGYGNAEVPEGSDSFWLGEGLAISPNEQIDFLTQLLSGNLQVSDQAIEALQDVSLSREIDGLTVHGKTGAGPVRSGDFSGPFDGWYVGFVERQNARPAVFALYARGQGFQSIRTFREDFATHLLVHAGLLPEAFSQ